MSEEATNTVDFASPLLALGETRVPFGSPLWERVNETAPHDVVTFPRRAFGVVPGRGAPFAAHAGLALRAPKQRAYRREPIDAVGEWTQWLWMSPTLRDELEHAAGVGGTQRGWSRRMPGALVVEQRRLAALARGRTRAAVVEEAALSFLRALMRLEATDELPRRGKAHRAVARVIEHLSGRPTESHSLGELARIGGLTESHLCVVFRRETGATIGEYADGLRLAQALERLEGRADRDLSAIAHELGYSSHSHFSARFRRRFGCTPREARARLALS